MPVNDVYVVGLTGGIGCGKSMAAQYLESLGALHIDADGISRELTRAGGAAIAPIREAFGDGVFCEDGTLNRRALADIVFQNAAAKRVLEGIIHPMVQRRGLELIAQGAQSGARVAIMDVPLLFETGMDVLCDETWAISVPEEVQLARVCDRDNLSEEQARMRISSQMPMAERNARATRVIDSNRPIEKTQAELNRLYNQLLHRL